MKVKLAILLCLLCGTMHAQTARQISSRDSMERILANNPSAQTLHQYAMLGVTFMHADPEQLNRFAANIYRASEKAGWPFAEGRVLILRSVVTLDASKFDSTLVYLEQLLQVAQATSDTISLLLYHTNSGITLKRLSRFEQAVDAYYQGLELAEKYGSHAFMLSFYNNLSSLYNSIDDFESAKKVIREAISLFKKHNKEGASGLGSLYGNLAVAYKRTMQLDSALYYYEKSREELEMVHNVAVSGVYCNIGILYGELKQYDQAEEYLQKALLLTRKHRQANYEVNVLNALADIRTDQDRYKEAIGYASEAMTLAKQISMPDALSRSLDYLHSAYARLGNYQMAYKLFQESNVLKDSIYDIEKEEIVKEIKEKYETVKKDEAIRYANVHIEEQRRRSYFLIGIVMVFALLVLYIGFLYVRTGRLNRKIKAQAEAMEQQNENLENANRVKEKLFAVVSHDLRSPVSSLHALMVLMNKPNLGEERISLLKQELQKQLLQTTGLMETLLNWAKTQMKGWEVSPKNVSVNEVALRLEEHFASYAADKQISLHLAGQSRLYVLADEQLVHIILYNLVSNAVKFTPQQGRVWLESGHLGDNVEIRICDTGQGMDAYTVSRLLDETVYESTKGTAREKGFGLGLKICIELARLMRGNIRVSSEEGKGSRFCLVLPAGREH